MGREQRERGACLRARERAHRHDEHVRPRRSEGSTRRRHDPKGARVADERFVYAYGLWAILSFQTRTKHFTEAERLLAAELEGTGLRLRLQARREQTESTLDRALCIFVENPKRKAASARARPIFRKIVALVGAPQTSLLAHRLACFHAFYREWGAARAMVERAVALGRRRAALEGDPDLAPLFRAANH